MFCGIEFRTIGWQENDPHILGNLEVLGFVPSGFVHYHEDELIGVTLRHLRGKQRHGVRIDHRERTRETSTPSDGDTAAYAYVYSRTI